MSRLRVGIVGCGSVAQIVHLPTLNQLSDFFEVTALCDVSLNVLAGVGRDWGVATRVSNYQDLLALDTVDAVLIANPDVFHAEATIAALRAGKHVMVEKPMCLNLAENDAIIAAQKEAGKIVQVGTMRRYAPAFIEACRLVKDMDEIRLAKAHDLIGRNPLVIEPTSRVVPADDIPASVSEAMRERGAEAIRAAIGDVPDALATAYRMMLGLSSHDLSAMREMLGMPQRVLYAAQRCGGRYQTAAFDYGDYICQFSTGVDNIPRFDTYLQVYGDNKVVRVDYDTPFVRNLPIRLTVAETTDGVNNMRTVTHPGWGDAFTEEWRAFHHNVISGTSAKTSPQDFRKDLLLFRDMIQLMAGATAATD
ncbi:MAG: Gfo/Idh/MocA family oxidoreductase [Chloroflexi bacterium]|nr:Gfo/Idh/MocA family oxidoreductase [Chloroflexota bacterium]